MSSKISAGEGLLCLGVIVLVVWKICDIIYWIITHVRI